MSIGLAASLACMLEVSAEKVGNVTPSQRFADACFHDFVSSALALGPAIARAVPSRVGWAIYHAVKATRRVSPTNTYLGVALLLAPLAAAWSPERPTALRGRLAGVLRDLSVDDARWAYRAIRLAAPGGLGSVRRADVSRAPRVTLREAMALAAGRDSIASEYVHDFALTFEVVLPALRNAMRQRLSALDAIVQTHLELIACIPDTLIARKAGETTAREVSAKARTAVQAGGVRTRAGRAVLRSLDLELRADGNRLNPGTTADLTAAGLFVWLIQSGGRDLP
jgi:triphosphoribosyl-dephospho-CoA synthase